MQLGVHTCVWNAIAYSSACRTPFLGAKMYSTRWYVVLAFQLNVFRLHRHKTVTPTELDLIDSERSLHLWPSTSGHPPLLLILRLACSLLPFFLPCRIITETPSSIILHCLHYCPFFLLARLIGFRVFQGLPRSEMSPNQCIWTL